MMWLTGASAAASSALYLWALSQQNMNVYILTALRVLPILCLLLCLLVGAALQNSDPPYRNAICCGLVLSVVGDVLLEMEEALPVLLIFGLTAFLWAKAPYIWAFKLDVGAIDAEYGLMYDRILLVSGLGFLLYAGTTLAFLLPGLDPLLFLPLLLYVFVNSVLGVLSILRTSNVALSRASRACAVLGALLWVASDTLLGIDRFHHRLPHGKLAIMATYYAGQAGIALSAMGGQLEQQGPQKVRLARWGTNFFSYGYQWVDKQQ